MSHEHCLDEFDDETLLHELLLRAERRAKPVPAQVEQTEQPPQLHLVTDEGDIACGEPRPYRATSLPVNITCQKCLEVHKREHKRKNGTPS
jgi:hypothetical protein